MPRTRQPAVTPTTKDFYTLEHTMQGMMNNLAPGMNLMVNNTTYHTKKFKSFASESELRTYFTLLMSNPAYWMYYGNIPTPKLKISNQLQVHSQYRSADQSINIANSPDHFQENILLHELAHHIVHCSGFKDNDSHGDVFARELSKLYGVVRGDDTGKLLNDLHTSGMF